MKGDRRSITFRCLIKTLNLVLSVLGNFSKKRFLNKVSVSRQALYSDCLNILYVVGNSYCCTDSLYNTFEEVEQNARKIRSNSFAWIQSTSNGVHCAKLLS